MFINMSNFRPKSGQESAFREFFENEVLPITLSAEGLITADVYISPDGVITNIEHWESEALWKVLTDGLIARTDLMEQFQDLVENFWEYPLTSIKTFRSK